MAPRPTLLAPSSSLPIKRQASPPVLIIDAHRHHDEFLKRAINNLPCIIITSSEHEGPLREKHNSPNTAWIWDEGATIHTEEGTFTLSIPFHIYQNTADSVAPNAQLSPQISSCRSTPSTKNAIPAVHTHPPLNIKRSLMVNAIKHCLDSFSPPPTYFICHHPEINAWLEQA